jgi:hypothetical protein
MKHVKSMSKTMRPAPAEAPMKEKPVKLKPR